MNAWSSPSPAAPCISLPFARRAAFTLIELMTVLVIISILSGMALGGLALARQRAKAVRTESTIRKIHEVVMPHYERYLGKIPPQPTEGSQLYASLNTRPQPVASLVRMRRLQAIELPDRLSDLAYDPAWKPSEKPNETNSRAETAISRRLRQLASGTSSSSNADAEALWAIVMQGGFADPAIISHFREDEFGDTDDNGRREFIDGWGKPIRFLRWAPGFVSRYQPAPGLTQSHDVFDSAAVDPLATNTLFPLIFSGGPDGQPDIFNRMSDGAAAVNYAAFMFDPYFANRPDPPSHLGVPYLSSRPAILPFGTVVRGVPAGGTFVSDDITNHSLSR